MEKFKVINGGLEKIRKREEKKKKFLLDKYKTLYENYLYGIDCIPDIKKTVFFGIKYINLHSLQNCDYKELLKLYLDIQDIKISLSFITYNDLINLFPINKEYDGHKFECKDYYTTIEYLSTKNLNEKIGVQNIDEILWYYYNNYIMNFSVKEMLIIDRLLRFRGKEGLLEGFIKHIGLDKNVHSYTLDKRENCMYDNITGERIEIKKKKEEHPEFKIIVGNQHTD